MRRLFWVGVGAATAVALAGRARRLAHRYTPAGVTEQVEAAGQSVGAALQHAVDTFRTSAQARERDLVTTLLVTPEGGDAGAVLRRGRREGAADVPAVSEPPYRAPHAAGTPAARPTGRVDDDDSPYDF